MINFVLTTLAVMVGTLMAYGVVLALVLNKKVLKAYTKYAVKVGQEVSDELINDLDKEEA